MIEIIFATIYFLPTICYFWKFKELNFELFLINFLFGITGVVWICLLFDVFQRSHAIVKQKSKQDTIKEANLNLENSLISRGLQTVSTSLNLHKDESCYLVQNATLYSPHKVLTKKATYNLIATSNCYYCNLSYSLVWGKNCYNGIDRLDSSKHYTTNNCVPCCKFCNYGKRKETPEFWQEHIERMRTYYSKNHKKIKKEFRSRGFEI